MKVATYTRAAIYTRFSTEMQREASSEDQARNCRKRITAEGWHADTHYKDEGISGSTDERPAYQLMIEAGLADKFDVLVLDDLGRLSRDQVESERVIRRLEFAGVRIVSGCGYDSTLKGRKLHRGFKGLMNEMFLDDLREKVWRGQEGQVLKHFSAGGKAYGYRPVKVLDGSRTDRYGEPAILGFRREIVPEQADIVREIFRRYADGDGLRTIASDLNTRGIPSPGASWKRKTRRKDGVWLNTSIHGILRNSVYIGRPIWNRNRWDLNPDTRRRCKIKRPESERRVTDMPELAIVPRELWDRVEQRISARAHAYPAETTRTRSSRGGQPKYLLSSLLVCDLCGQKMVCTGNRPAAYSCSSFRDGGPGACSNALRVPRQRVEERLIAPIVKELLSPAAVALAEREMRRLYHEYQKADRQKPARDSERVARLDAQIGQLERLLADGVLSPEVAGPSIAKAKADRGALLAAQPEENPSKLDRVVKLLPRVAAAYRGQVAKILEVLSDEKAVHRARNALKELLDAPVRLRPTAENTHMVAEICYSPRALLKAAGGDLWIGSGGAIAIHKTLIDLGMNLPIGRPRSATAR